MKLPTLRNIALVGAMVLLCAPLQAQIFGAANDTATRVWRIRFQADIKVKSLNLTETDRYEGEYYATNAVGERYWMWNSYDKTTKNVHKTKNVYSQRLTFSANIWKDLYLGFGYTSLMVIPPYNPNGGTAGSSKLAFSTHALLAYRYQLPLKFYPNRISLCPQVAYGAYMSAPTDQQGYFGNTIEGPGKERFAEGLFAIEVSPLRNRNIALRAWAGYSVFMYRESETSFIYRDKTRKVFGTEQFSSVGLGVNYTLAIREDAKPKQKHSKKSK